MHPNPPAKSAFLTLVQNVQPELPTFEVHPQRLRLPSYPQIESASQTNLLHQSRFLREALPMLTSGDSGMIQFLIGSDLFIRSNPAFLGDKLGQDVVTISVMKGGKR
jgi:hypothetical protein